MIEHCCNCTDIRLHVHAYANSCERKHAGGLIYRLKSGFPNCLARCTRQPCETIRIKAKLEDNNEEERNHRKNNLPFIEHHF